MKNVNKSAIGLFMLMCKMALFISLIYIHTLILMLHCRFGGGEFPPMIFFKIFIHTEGKGLKYMSGRRVIKPASEVIRK